MSYVRAGGLGVDWGAVASALGPVVSDLVKKYGGKAGVLVEKYGSKAVDVIKKYGSADKAESVLEAQAAATAPPPASTNYTPWILGGSLLLGALLILRRR